MDATITPAAELASETAGFNLFTPEHKIVHPDWTQMMQSYDQDYERQVATIQDLMQRYGVLLVIFATTANLPQARCTTSSWMRARGL
jgi:hypothetical protein